MPVTPISYSQRYLTPDMNEGSPFKITKIPIKSKKSVASSTIDSSGYEDLNYNFQNYQALRSRLIDKVSSTLVMLKDPFSSLRKCVSQLNGHPILYRDRANMSNFLKNLEKSANILLKTDSTDISTYFDTVKNFTETLNKLYFKLLSYSNKSDYVDEFNPLEAAGAIKRIVDDFSKITLAEDHFPKEFRNTYIQANVL